MGNNRASSSKDFSAPQGRGKNPAQAPPRRSNARPGSSGGSSKGRESDAGNSSAEGNGSDRRSANGCAGNRKLRKAIFASIVNSGAENAARHEAAARVLRRSKAKKRSRRPAPPAKLVMEPPPPPPPAVVVVQEQRPRVVVRREPSEEYQFIPGLDDDLALLCLARVPRFDYGRFNSLNRKFCALMDSGELYKVRRRNGIVERWICMVASGHSDWQAFDPQCGRWKKLPSIEADFCYYSCDKESFSVGTQLLVVGRNAGDGLVTWRYDLASNRWGKGASMLTPRCLYAWGSCGKFAFVAGGVTLGGDLIETAEQYDPETEHWEKLPDMSACRRLCAGCFLDGKFYVIGGKDSDGEHLTSAEVYDPILKTWTVIPDMLPPVTSSFPGAPPLIAVVNNELYLLDAESNQLRLYLKATNSWKILGEVPVRTDLVSGWGVAFKSLGDQLLVVGGARTSAYADGMHVCTPGSIDAGQPLQWSHLTKLYPFGPFVLNCAIVSA